MQKKQYKSPSVDFYLLNNNFVTMSAENNDNDNSISDEFDF